MQLPGLAEEFADTSELRWPEYIANDIVGYFVFPERRRIYRSELNDAFASIHILYVFILGEAEKEILTLAPHFEPKNVPESFDAKLDRLNLAASQDITWLHLLSNIFILISWIQRQLLSIYVLFSF